MARLALYTFAVGHDPWGSDALASFDAAEPGVVEEARRADGFVALALEPPDPDRPRLGQDYGPPWGVFEAPRFFAPWRGEGGTERAALAATLSLWRDLATARRFSYGGPHRAALGRRRGWFRDRGWPAYVLWWVGDGEAGPTWAGACARLERLHDLGPTPEAFDFRRPFDPVGHPVADAVPDRRQDGLRS